MLCVDHVHESTSLRKKECEYERYISRLIFCCKCDRFGSEVDVHYMRWKDFIVVKVVVLKACTFSVMYMTSNGKLCTTVWCHNRSVLLHLTLWAGDADGCENNVQEKQSLWGSWPVLLISVSMVFTVVLIVVNMVFVMSKISEYIVAASDFEVAITETRFDI